jgi:hypothetical protein
VPGQSEQKQDRTEDAFVIQHREALRKNPEGVSFTLRLEEDKVQFKPGEIIRVEFNFTSDLPSAYELDGATYDRGGRLNLDKYFLDHKNGVVDPLRDYLSALRGGISSNPTLSEKPHKMTFDLNEWFRFDQPGKFRIYVTAPRVSKKGERQFRNGAEVTSNIVEFEILPHDDEWAEQELQSITRLLDSSNQNIDRRPLCRRLRFLNTEAAANEMIRRFGAPLDVCGYEYSMGLIGSAHRAFAVKEMERRLEAPDQIVTEVYLFTLSRVASLLQQKEQLQSQYAERLMSALPSKQGKARAIAAHTLLEMSWKNSSQSLQPSISNPRRPGGLDPEIIKKLAPDIIAIFDDLPANIQSGLLGHRWKQLADPAMLPILRRIFSANPSNISPNEGAQLRNLALRRLYELSPDEGRKLILEELRRPDPTVNPVTLGILSDETLPELDETLVENLEKRLGDLFVLSALIERYATVSVSPRVRAFYSDKAGQWACSIQSSLLAYLLRTDAATGIDLIKHALAARGKEYTRCYVSLLVEVAKLRMTPELEALAIEHLDDPDPEVVISAASMLGQYGSTGAEKPLWRRLEKWLQEWKGRGEELPKNFDSSHPNFWPKQVGHALRQALSHSPAWRIDREKLERLRQSCLDKDDLQRVNFQAAELSGEIRIDFQPGYDGWGNAHVANYHCNSLPALKMKLAQFPKNTTFIWNSYSQDQEAAEQVFSELKAFLEGKGMKLEKRKGQ